MHRRRVVLAALLAALTGACRRRPKLAPIGPGQTVLAFGDSVTFGTGAGPGEDWPSRLASRTGWSVHNAGIPGDTAEAGQERIAALVESLRPALVLVEIGGNDLLRRRPQKAVKEDIRRIIHRARQGGAQVVLVAVPELSLLGAVTRKPADAPLYGELGEEEHVPVIAAVFAGILAHPEWCADPIHPNARGYQELAAGIHARLQELGLAPS